MKKIKNSTKGYKSDSPDNSEDALRINSSHITMKGVPHPVIGIDDMGNQIMMYPGGDYQFPGNSVIEYPIRQASEDISSFDDQVDSNSDGSMRYGGLPRKKKLTSKNIQSSINSLMMRNYILFGPKGKNYFRPYIKGEGGCVDCNHMQQGGVTDDIRTQWNTYVDWLDKKGMKGKPDLDNNGLGYTMVDEYQRDNPNSGINRGSIKSIQQEFSKYRDWSLGRINRGEAVLSPGVRPEDYMKDLSIIDGYPGQRTTSFKFPSTYLQSDPNMAVKQGFASIKEYGGDTNVNRPGDSPDEILKAQKDQFLKFITCNTMKALHREEYNDFKTELPDIEKLQVGGPIIVDDEKDSRLKAYKDSLELYNMTKDIDRWLRTAKRDSEGAVDYGEFIKVTSSRPYTKKFSKAYDDIINLNKGISPDGNLVKFKAKYPDGTYHNTGYTSFSKPKIKVHYEGHKPKSSNGPSRIIESTPIEELAPVIKRIPDTNIKDESKRQWDFAPNYKVLNYYDSSGKVINSEYFNYDNTPMPLESFQVGGPVDPNYGWSFMGAENNQPMFVPGDAPIYMDPNQMTNQPLVSDPYNQGSSKSIFRDPRVPRNMEPLANKVIAGIDSLTAFFNNKNKTNYDWMQGADNQFNVMNAGDRGDYDINSGMFRPNSMVPVQFSGYNVPYNYEEGGEYYMDEKDIELILKSGGEVKYLD